MTKQAGIAVSVTMKTRITVGDESQVNDLSTEGKLFCKENGFYLQFKEEIAEVGTVNQIIKIDAENAVTVLRQGAVSMKQLFLQGETTEGVYRSPFGAMLMNTKTKQIDVKIVDHQQSGTIQLSYQLHIQSEFAGDYEVTITFRRKH